MHTIINPLLKTNSTLGKNFKKKSPLTPNMPLIHTSFAYAK
jgi:hypothetical protein